MTILTKWIYRSSIFVPADQRESANTAHSLYWPGQDAEVFTFDIPLSSNGMLPASYYGCYTAVTEGLWAMWKDLMPVISPDAIYYREHFSEGILLETSSSTAQLGSTFHWNDALEDSDLRPIVQEGI